MFDYKGACLAGMRAEGCLGGGWAAQARPDQMRRRSRMAHARELQARPERRVVACTDDDSRHTGHGARRLRHYRATGQVNRRSVVLPVVAVGHVRTRVRIFAIRYVSVEQRPVVVLVLGAVLVFHGRMDMNQRGCKHSDQERRTEYCYASSSHKRGMLVDPDPGVNEHACSRAVDNAS